MKSIGIILEYTGPIHTLRRWSQELMSYNFVPLHRPCTMMKDVDALNRGPYHRVINSYNALTSLMREHGKKENTAAYDTETFNTLLTKGIYSVKCLKKSSTKPASDVSIAVMLVRASAVVHSRSISKSATSLHTKRKTHSESEQFQPHTSCKKSKDD